jgi:hypothetical protein
LYSMFRAASSYGRISPDQRARLAARTVVLRARNASKKIRCFVPRKPGKGVQDRQPQLAARRASRCFGSRASEASKSFCSRSIKKEGPKEHPSSQKPKDTPAPDNPQQAPHSGTSDDGKLGRKGFENRGAKDAFEPDSGFLTAPLRSRAVDSPVFSERKKKTKEHPVPPLLERGADRGT